MGMPRPNPVARWLLVVGFAASACWHAEPPRPPLSAPPRLAPLPVCPVRLDAGHLFVNGVDLGVMVADPDDEIPRTLSIYQTGDDAYVAWKAESYRGPFGSDVLWHVSCAGKKLGTWRSRGADFGHAALHPDRRWLFYSARGVMRLDLASHGRTPVTSGATVSHCWDSDGDDVQLSDSVTAVTRDYVEFTRGGPCGFEADYDATRMRHHFATGVDEAATPVTSIAMVGPEIWLAEGDGCQAVLYRSKDWRTWTRMTVPDLVGPLSIAGDRASRTAIVMSSGCGYGEGGAAKITRDGGATWTPIGDIYEGMLRWMQGADLTSLRVGAGDNSVLRWDGQDLDPIEGERWSAFPRPASTHTVGGRTVELTAFGMIDKETGTRLFP